MSEATKARHYKELVIWQRAMQLVKSVYRLTKAFPSEERYGLPLQMRRAAVSSAIWFGIAALGSSVLSLGVLLIRSRFAESHLCVSTGG